MAKKSVTSKKRVVNVSVLPGEPTDGTGRVCIHLFVLDERGSFTEPHVLLGVGVAGPARGRLACDPKRTVATVTRGNVVTVTMRTHEARAVTCLKCKASDDYKTAMEQSGT